MKEKRSDDHALQALFCETLLFTMEDLAANQQGCITSAQIERLTASSLSYSLSTTRLPVIGGAVLIALNVLIVGSSSEYGFLVAFISALCLMPFLLPIVVVIRRIMQNRHARVLRSLEENDLEYVQGELRVFRRVGSQSRNGSKHVLAVDRCEFVLSPQQCDKLRNSMPSTQQAIVYYVPAARREILSIDLV